MEMLAEFMDDLGISKDLQKELRLLITNNADLKHFEDEIFSAEKSFEAMTFEMRKHKVINHRMSVSEFRLRFAVNDLEAVSTLFGHYISEDDWNELRYLMKVKNITYSDIYSRHVENLHFNSICNIWQTIL
ncbi:TPA: hypothetical protein ROY14_001052 [Bacillus mobilis]|uniref:hypothetical protein n=1 Tax=Bacillus mobilis TaxID=2026190 RepID=UPI0011A92B69|nr:hypothetical protein [Bacillus mobilis]MED4384978.1 hypothetical protein [Bacillus mobilis]HDX9638999.1 hypothetical protein [Bacillus mobilis]